MQHVGLRCRITDKRRVRGVDRHGGGGGVREEDKRKESEREGKHGGGSPEEEAPVREAEESW